MIRLNTLGESLLEIDAHRIGPAHDLMFALMLVLCVERPRRVARTFLRDLFWPDADEQRASHCLRQNVYKLRRLGAPIDSRPGDIGISRALVTVDYEERLTRTDYALDESASGWSFLPGYAPTISDPFSEWVERLREGVQHRLRDRVLADVRVAKVRTDWGRTASLARVVLSVDPLNEEATLLLAEAKALSGSKAEAVDLLDRFVVQMDGKSDDLKLQPRILRRRIAERLPMYRRDESKTSLFIGRDGLLAMLSAHAMRVKGKVGSVSALWGDPGIGKTRLLVELAAVAVVDGFAALMVGCQPSFTERPLATLELLTTQLLALPGALGVDPDALKTLRRLAHLDPGGAPPPDSPAHVEYEQSKLRMALLDVVDAVSAERPLLIAIDDAHWMDAVSSQFVSMIAEQSRQKRVAIVIASRTRQSLPAAATTGREDVLMVTVPALTPGDTARLVGDLVARHGTPARPELAERAAAVANGNPLYVHALVEHWSATGDVESLPPTLAALIEQRLDTLHPRAMRCLQACALLGRFATVARIESALETPRQDLLDSMDILYAAGLIVAVEQRLEVRHGLIGEACKKRLSEPARQLLHRFIARTIEPEARESNSVALQWACAEHLRLAGEEQRAEDLLDDCGRHFLAVGLPAAAADLFGMLAGVARSVGRRTTALENLSHALRAASRWIALKQARDEYLLLISSSVDDSHPPSEDLYSLEALARTDWDHASLYVRAMTLVRDEKASIPDRIGAANLAIMLADSLCAVDSLTDAFREHALLTRDGDDPLSVALAELMFFTATEDLTVAQKAADTLVALTRKEGSPHALSRALRNAGAAYRFSGDFHRAQSLLRESNAIAERHGLDSVRCTALAALASSALDQGHFSDAVKWLDEADLVAASADDQHAKADTVVLRVRSLLAEGRLADANARWTSLSHLVSPRNSPRARTDFLAIDVALELDRPESDTLRGKLNELAAAISSTIAWGCQDFAVAVCCRALTALGEYTEAQAFVTSYISSERRETGPVSWDLARVL